MKMDIYNFVAQDKITLTDWLKEEKSKIDKLDKLTFNIKYDISKNKFETSGSVKEEGRKELVDTFLRFQIGAGEDKRKANERDVYNIRLEWYPQNDNIRVTDNTGNKGLRDGILIHYINYLNSL